MRLPGLWGFSRPFLRGLKLTTIFLIFPLLPGSLFGVCRVIQKWGWTEPLVWVKAAISSYSGRSYTEDRECLFSLRIFSMGALKLANFIISEPLSTLSVHMLCDSRKRDELYMFHCMLNHNAHSKKMYFGYHFSWKVGSVLFMDDTFMWRNWQTMAKQN